MDIANNEDKKKYDRYMHLTYLYLKTKDEEVYKERRKLMLELASKGIIEL